MSGGGEGSLGGKCHLDSWWMFGSPISFSLWRSHLFVPGFNYGIRRTGEPRGTSGASGREWETGEQRKGEKMKEDSNSVVVAILLLSPVCRGGRDTHAGFLSNAAETFMKSLQKQGRQALFLSPNWFSCSRCCASDFIAARPSPPLSSLTASAPFQRLVFSSLPRLSLPSRPPTGLGAGRAPARDNSDWSTLCRRLWQPIGAWGQASVSHSGLCQHLIVHPPISPAFGNGVQSSKKKFQQLKCCAPEHLPNVPHLKKVYAFRHCCQEDRTFTRQTVHLLLLSRFMGAPHWSSWRGQLAGKGWKSFPCLGRQRNRARCAPFVLPVMFGVVSPPPPQPRLKCWEFCQHQVVFYSYLHAQCLANRELGLQNVGHSEISEWGLILSTKKWELKKTKECVYRLRIRFSRRFFNYPNSQTSHGSCAGHRAWQVVWYSVEVGKPAGWLVEWLSDSHSGGQC